MLSSAPVIAFVATKDPARAKTFYQNVLKLNLTSDDPFALVFDANETMLRVTKVKDFTPAPYTVLGWNVPKIDAAVEELAERGVVFERYESVPQDSTGVWVSPSGAKVAWFKDPDGNTLSLTEFPQL